MIDIAGLLSNDGFVMANKTLIRLYGTDCAVLVGELCAEYKYYSSRNQLETFDGKEYFYSTQENIYENTGISAYYQRSALAKLKEAGIVTVTKKGLPAKNYFCIDFDVLIKLFTVSTNSRAASERIDERPVNLNNIAINNNKKEETIISKDIIVPEKQVTEKDDFFGSISAKKTKKPNKYLEKINQCRDNCYSFTNNMEVQNLLIQYLELRLEIKDKPIYNVAQWNGILDKLSDLSKGDLETMKKIIKQSIEHGYASFYPLNSKQKFQQTSCEDNVKSDRMTEDDYIEQEQQIKKWKAEGKRVKF